MQKKEYSPVLIPTLCRYEHFKRCVESLANNTHADKTELVIGIDYPPAEMYFNGWQAINDYVGTISGFKKVTVFNANQNIGAIENFRKLTNYACLYYDSYIISEDDNEFSPCFLDYINKALLKYWDDNRVSAVCGYSFPVDLSEYRNNVYFYHDQAAWGLARWKHKRSLISNEFKDEVFHSFRKMCKLYWRDSRLFYYLLDMVSNGLYWGDALNGICNVINDQFVLYPKVSMCRNHGHDGSGLHCGNTEGDDIYSNQFIDTSNKFELDDIEVKETQIKAINQYFKLSTVRKLSCIKHYLKYQISKNK